MKYSDMAVVIMPTREQVEAEPAGRQLNAWMHRFVMDMPCRMDGDGSAWTSEDDLGLVGLVGYCRLPDYLGNIVRAMDVLCKSRDGMDFMMIGHGDEYRCHIYGRGNGGAGLGTARPSAKPSAAPRC